MAKTKTGSSLRKGFEYEDRTALCLALELYIDNIDFEMFLQYGKAGGLDDIVIVFDSEVHAYQVKHAQNPFDAYRSCDFAENTEKRVRFSKFSKYWLSLKTRLPIHKLSCHLLSNRSLDATFGLIVDRDGYFTAEFMENRLYKQPRQFRSTIKEICNLEEDDLRHFLSCFHFDMNRPSLTALEGFIKGNLLDHRLGISEPAIYFELLNEIRDFSVDRHEPLTSVTLDRILHRIITRYLLPQKFAVDSSSFVRVEAFAKELDGALLEADGEYVVITGLPGSGKSTSLTAYLDSIERDSGFIVVRYYCFTNINDNFQRQRLEAQSLRVNILSDLQRRFSHLLDRRYDFSNRNFFTVLETLGRYFHERRQKLIVFLDGLDHAERDSNVLQDVFTSLPQEIPEGVVFLIGTQELQRWNPLALKDGRERRHVSMPLFSVDEVREFFERHDFCLTEEQIAIAYRKSEGLPLYLNYVVQLLQEYGQDEIDIDGLPPAENGQIRTYYETLWGTLESLGRGKSKHLCSVVACLNFKVHTSELFDFQSEIALTEFEDSYRAIQHLLRVEDSLVSVFHDSFRVFVLYRIDDAVKKGINRAIAKKLKSESSS